MLLNGSAINQAAINGSSQSIAVLYVKKAIAARRYTCTMRADGVDDVVIPISSINGRLNSDRLSALTIVCPNGVDYAAAILDRADGSFIISTTETYSDGTQATSDSQEFSNLSITYHQGSHNYSVTLRGEKRITLNSPPRKIAIQGVNYIALQGNGFRNVRCTMDKDFLPGDTAILPDGDEVVMNVVTYSINPRGAVMELTET